MPMDNDPQPTNEKSDRDVRTTLLVVRAKLREALALSRRRRR
jgi:hypothetical protein